jgi:hypothetical protein
MTRGCLCVRPVPYLAGSPNSSGSLAMFAAIRRASSRVSSLAAERLPVLSRTTKQAAAEDLFSR